MAHFDPIEVEKSLKGIEFPADKGDITDIAEKNGANKEVIDLLDGLPDTEYDSPTDIMEELGDESNDNTEDEGG